MPSGVYKRTKPVWNKGLTKDTDERIAKAEQNRQATNKERYGTTNIFQSEPVLARIEDDRHSGKIAKKAMDTKELRYGDRNYNNMDKNHETKLLNHDDPNYNNPDKKSRNKNF